jgi:hypothetical protein
VYELVFQKSSSYTGDTAAKVKQEILHGLGELYVQSSKMFDDKMYMQLLGIVDLAIKQAIINSENFETEYVSLFSNHLLSSCSQALILSLFHLLFQGTCTPCTTSCFGNLALFGAS